MTARKSGKSALDYDPLAWLKGEAVNEDEAAPLASAAEQSPAKQSADQDDVLEATPTASRTNAERDIDSTGGVDGMVETTIEATVDGYQQATIVDESNLEVATPVETVEEGSDMTDTPDEFLHLGSELTMKNVAEFKENLDRLMREDSPISIDADALRKIDSAGLQLLYSLQKTLAKNGGAITWKKESDIVKASAAIIAMDFSDIPGSRDTAEIEAEQGFGFF